MKKLSIVLVVVAVFTLLLSGVVAYSTAEEVSLESLPQVVVHQPTFTVDLTGIVLAVMGVITTIILKYVIPLLKTERARKLAQIAVQSAEQLFTTGVIDDKLAYAEQWLLDHGVKLDRRALVEAAVAELNQYKKELEYQSEFLNPADYDEFDDVDEDEDDDEEPEVEQTTFDTCSENGCAIPQPEEKTEG